jgi:hypothetical protein
MSTYPRVVGRRRVHCDAVPLAATAREGDASMPEQLRALNARNAAFWAERAGGKRSPPTSAASPTTAKTCDCNASMPERLKALNARHAAFWAEQGS